MRKLLVFLSIISMFLGNNLNLCNSNINSNLLCKNNINNVEESDVVQHSPSNSNYSIELDIKNTPYTKEIISITGIVDKQYKIECNSTDIEIITSNIDNISNLLLEFKLNTSKEEFEVNLNFKNNNNDIVDTITLYINKTELGTFISQVSNKVNVENYKTYQLETNEISQVEYDAYNAEVNINAASTSIGFHDGFPEIKLPDTIYGTFKWTDNQGNTYPLKDCYVELIRSEGNSQSVIQNGYTDDSGNYSFLFIADTTVSNTDIIKTPFLIIDSYKYFVRIYSKTEHSGVVKSLDSNNNYYYDTAGIPFIDFSNTINSFDLSYTFTNDGLEDNYIGRAFEISQALYYGEKYVYEMSGEHQKFETIEYPSSSKNPEAGSHTASKGIYLGKYVYCYWDLILHEYGHHIQESYEISLSPEKDNLEHYVLEDDIKNNGKLNGIKLAWKEAWPTVFGNLVTQYYGSELIGIQYVNDDNYDAPDENNLRWGHSLENNLYKNKIIKLGEGCEANIMQVLYDLYDNNTNEEFDNIALGHKGLWDLIITNKPSTFDNLVQKIYNNSSINLNDFNKILAEYGMSAANITVSYFSIDTPPVIGWDDCNNGRSNDYSLEFINEYGTLLYKISVSKNKNVTIVNDIWNNIISSYGCYFGIRVKSFSTKDYSTGPYTSEAIFYLKPNIKAEQTLIFSENDRIIDKTIAIVDAYSFKITFQNSGTKVIQTLGLFDTCLTISKNYKVLYYDDDSGYNTNAFICTDLNKNEEYTITVSPKNIGSIVLTKLLVTETNGYTSLNKIKEYNDIETVNSEQLNFASNHEKYYSKAFIFIPKSTKNYSISLTSYGKNYLYVLDPRSSSTMVKDVDYNEGDNYGNSSIIKPLVVDIPYLIIISQYNPSDDLSNNRCYVFII